MEDTLSVEDMLSNMAVASQNATLLDDPVTRGAVLRSIEQWLRFKKDRLDAQPGSDLMVKLGYNALMLELQDHEDYQS